MNSNHIPSPKQIASAYIRMLDSESAQKIAQACLDSSSSVTFEDTVLFASLGVCAWWLLLFRIPLAIIAVWAKRLSDKFVFTSQLAILHKRQAVVKFATNR